MFQSAETLILPVSGMFCFGRIRRGSSPHACLRMGIKVFMRFAANEPAANKALQECKSWGALGFWWLPMFLEGVSLQI